MNLTKEKAPLPECVAQYAGVEFDAIPSLAELHTLYSRYGKVSRYDRFPIVLEKIGKTIIFRSREQAWDYWLKHRDCLEFYVPKDPF